MATTQEELDLAFIEIANQLKARTASGGLNLWGQIPIAIIPKNGTLPTPLPTWGLVVEMPD